MMPVTPATESQLESAFDDLTHNATADIQPSVIAPGETVTLTNVWAREEPFWPKKLIIFEPGAEELSSARELQVLHYKIGRFTVVKAERPKRTWRLSMFEGVIRQYGVVRQGESLLIEVRNDSDKPVTVGLRFSGTAGVDVLGTAGQDEPGIGVEFSMSSADAEPSFHPFDVARRVFGTAKQMWEGFKNGRARAVAGEEPPIQLDDLFRLPGPYDDEVPAGILNNGRALIVEGIDVFRLGVEIIRERLDPPLPEPDHSRRYAAGFKMTVLDKDGKPTAKDHLEAGERAVLTATPLIHFRPDRLLLDASVQDTVGAAGWLPSFQALSQVVITDIKVGNHSQLVSAEPLEARFFGPENRRELRLDVCQPSVFIRLEVTNRGPRPVALAAMAEGQALDS